MSFQVVPPQGSVHRLYLSIIDEVTDNIRDLFLDEGLDEAQLNEFAHVWQLKLDSSKAVDVQTASNESDNELRCHNSPASPTVNPSTLFRRYHIDPMRVQPMPPYQSPHNSHHHQQQQQRILHVPNQPSRKISRLEAAVKTEPLDYSISAQRQFNATKQPPISGGDQATSVSKYAQNLRQHLQGSRPPMATGFAPFGTSLGCVPFDRRLMESAMLTSTNPSLNNTLANYLALHQNQMQNDNMQSENIDDQGPKGMASAMKTVDPRVAAIQQQVHPQRHISMDHSVNPNVQQRSSLIASKLLSQRKSQQRDLNDGQDVNFDADLLLRALSTGNVSRELPRPNLAMRALQQPLRDQTAIVPSLQRQRQNVQRPHLLPNDALLQQPRGSKRKQAPIPFEESLLLRGQRPLGNPTQQGSNGAMHPPQFDGTGDDAESLGSEIPPAAQSGAEYTSDEDDDDLDRFAAAIAPDLSDTNETVVEDSDPLNSGDDVSEEDPVQLFDSDNIIVCQFDKINRSKARWKFLLKEGIMNIRGKDYVFSRAQGEADW